MFLMVVARACLLLGRYYFFIYVLLKDFNVFPKVQRCPCAFLRFSASVLYFLWVARGMLCSGSRVLNAVHHYDPVTSGVCWFSAH